MHLRTTPPPNIYQNIYKIDLGTYVALCTMYLYIKPLSCSVRKFARRILISRSINYSL